MISIQYSQDSQNQKQHTQGSSDMTTELTQTMTLKFISETNQQQQVKIEDLKKSLSSEIPSIEVISKHSYLFTIQIQPYYLISLQRLKKSSNWNEEQLGIGGNGQVFLCTDLETLELHAVKLVSDIDFGHVNPILQECINQYNLMQFSKEKILNIVNIIQIKISNSNVDFEIPLELAEFSLYDYIQTNEISEEIYQQLTNILIDFLILLHTNKCAHRDIKPQNILYVKEVGWKLADFGESTNYEECQGMHKIKGTLSFIPKDVRIYSKKNKEILQDLFRNDLYATVCTLVMIKNPQFKSSDLQAFMQENQFDETCSRLINIIQVEELHQFKIEKQSMFQYSEKFRNRKDELVYYDVKLIIQQQSKLRKSLDTKIIKIIDAELGKLKENNKIIDYNKIVLKLIQHYPFQIDQFNNFNEDFDHYSILKDPQLYFSNNIELYYYYYENGFHQQLLGIKKEAHNPQSDTVESIFIRIYINILCQDIENAKVELNLLATKIYSETSQVNSDFLGYYNQMYWQLYNEYPIIQHNNPEDQLMKQLQDFQQKNLNEEDIQEYLKWKSFKQGDKLYLQALLHPLQPQFARFRTQAIFEHILYHLGSNCQYIQENKSLLSELIISHLRANDSHQKDLQLIIYGCITLYQNYDLLHELIGLLVYFGKVLAITKPGMLNLELKVEIQRLTIKYNIDIDPKIKKMHQYRMIFNKYLGLYDYIFYSILSNIYHLQLKLIKQQFKSRVISKFKLNIAIELLKTLKQISNQKYKKQKLYDLQNILSNYIIQSKPKYQKRFLQVSTFVHQQSTNKEQLSQHLKDLRQYKILKNNFNHNPYKATEDNLLIIAGILLKYYNLYKLLKYYPRLTYQLLLTCYSTNQKLFQDYKEHLNAIKICPTLQKKIPIHNQHLKLMYLFN